MLDVDQYAFLKFPQDVATLRRLSSSELICWYASQDPRSIIYLAQTKEFQRFWYRHYLLPLRIKRMLYKIKSLLSFKL